MIIHAGPTSHGIHRIEQIIQEGFIRGITLSVFVGIDYTHDERDIRGWRASPAVVTRMMSTSPLDIFGENREGRETERVHGIVDLFDGRPTIFGINAADTKELRVRRIDVSVRYMRVNY